jgi:hypothetical protein
LPHKFVSWVPTVTGFLSFSRIGKSTFPGKVKSAHFDSAEGKASFCAQERFLSDTNIPGLRTILPSGVFGRAALILRDRIDRWSFKGQTSRLWFLWVSQPTVSDLADRVTAKIYVFECEHLSGFRTLEQFLEDAAVTFREKGEFSISSGLERFHGITVDVCLFRNGAFLCECPSFSELEIEEFRKMGGVDLPMDMAVSAYCFVRDITHRHYHHSKTTDSILGVFPFKDEKWQEKIFNNLIRKIMLRRGSNYSEDMWQALGMVQYAKAYSNIFFRKGNSLEKNYPKEVCPKINEHTKGFQFETLEKSLEARIPLSISIKSGFSRFLSALRVPITLALACAAFMIAMAGLLQVGGNLVSDHIMCVGAECKQLDGISVFWKTFLLYVFKNPTRLMYSFIFLSLIPIVIEALSVGVSSGKKPYSSGFSRDITRLILAIWPKNRFGRAVSVFSIGLIVLMSTFYCLTIFI